MKTNNLSLYLFRPFVKIAGWKAFFIGLIIMAITGFTATYAGISFNGALDFHFLNNITFTSSFLTLTIDIICITICMAVIGLFITKNFRFIDILGTMTLAKAPFLIAAIAALFVKAPETKEILQNPLIILSYPAFILMTILSLPVLIWSIALMYNAFTISIGKKGSEVVIGFIIALLLAETISKILIFFLI